MLQRLHQCVVEENHKENYFRIIQKIDDISKHYEVIYRKIPKNLDTRKIAVIILKFEQCGSTIE